MALPLACGMVTIGPHVSMEKHEGFGLWVPLKLHLQL